MSVKPPRFGRWTSTNDQLPGRQDVVIYLRSNGSRGFGSGADLAVDESIVYWMPLPPCPDDLPGVTPVREMPKD